ncbi:MerR family DNA-binding protein [Streptomyces sp. WAC07094]|uniref:MerR family DNA-binding protein n=1 Tax=Streptomyces sp. WAC07094 TaxID=3072183 RepID=UPI002ECFA04E|nr:MerR family DNA-binding protein [Streptomyces sp. WAC07094]
MLRLRETGMPIAEMQRFAGLRARGEATVADRLAMLREHRAGVARRIRALRRNAAALDDKIDHYERLLEGQPGTDGPA